MSLLTEIGRIMLASIFILGGINKFTNYDATLADMARVGLEPADMLLPATIALEIIGGLLVAWGRYFGRLSAFALAIFALATNVYFHDFWNLEDQQRMTELSLFFKNIAIAGGLLFVTGTTPKR